MLQRVVAKDPQVNDAWLLLGNEYAKQGRYDRALAQYRRALELKPDDDLALHNMANEYRDMGRPNDAVAGYQAQRKCYEDAIASNPHFAEGHFFLAKLYLDRRDFTRAEALARRGLEIAPDGQWAPLGHFVRSDAYAALGQRDLAAKEAAEGRRLAARSKQ